MPYATYGETVNVTVTVTNRRNMALNASVTVTANTDDTYYNLGFSDNLGDLFLVPANSTSLFVFTIDYS